MRSALDDVFLWLLVNPWSAAAAVIGWCAVSLAVSEIGRRYEERSAQ